MDHYAVLGNPIQHSLSPFIHRLFARQTAQDIVYTSILVPLDGLRQSLDAFQSGGGKGVNITLPFKQQAYLLVDSVSERAARAGAINFIRFDSDGKRFGDNTDGIGLVRDLTRNHHFSIKNKPVLLLGAGGAIRGVIAAILNEQPKSITIANRTESKAVELAEIFSREGSVSACSFSSLVEGCFDLIINGTSASLQEELLELPAGLLQGETFCYDMVYGYGKGLTPFLQWARDNHATYYFDGIGMLIEQAAESFYLWRNIRPDIAQIKHTLLSNALE